MKTKFTKLIAGLAAALCITAFAATPVLAAASGCTDVCTCKDNNDNFVASEEVRRAAGCPNASPTDYDLGDSLQSIVNGVILFLGTVAVIVIVVGGVSYMTSNGDAGKIQKAKNTILYACIGLIICVLSFAIVNFTVAIIDGTSGSSDGDGEGDGSDPGAYIINYIA